MTPMGLTRAELLALDDLPTRDVPVPENWGGVVRVRCLNADERLQWGLASQKAMSGEPGPSPTALLVTFAAVDSNGERLFQIQDVDALAQKRGDVIADISAAVMDLSGLSQDDNASAVEVAEGNSDAAQSGTSPSVSPDNSDAQSPN